MKKTYKRAKDGVGFVEVLPADVNGHYMVCSVCGGDIDLRCLDQVAFHETHQPAPDIQYSGSIKLPTKDHKTDTTTYLQTLRLPVPMHDALRIAAATAKQSVPAFVRGLIAEKLSQPAGQPGGK
jgi:hypothetical protein